MIKRDKTYATVREIWEKNPDALSDEKIDELYEKLEKLTNVDAATKADHVQNIEQKYKKDSPQVSKDESPLPQEAASNSEAVAKEKERICPKCGSKLVVRMAKKGSNAGKSFYGCSAFPKCKYTENI